MNLIIRARKRNFLSRCSALIFLTAGFSISASAQYFPTFGAPTLNSTSVTSGSSPEGIALTSAPANSQANEVVAVLSQGGVPSTYISLDGVTYSGGISVSNSPLIYCDATPHADRCSPGIVTFGGHPYVVLRDLNSNLEVFKGTLSPGTNYYSWTNVLVQSVGNGGMYSSPQAVVFNGVFHIIYGVNSVAGITSGLSDTHSSDGVTWSAPSAANLGAKGISTPTQVGLSVLGSTLYMVSQQNNSQRHLWYWSSTDGTNWTGAQDNSLYVDSGLSMVTYSSNLVFAGKQDNSSDHVFLFSSPNGTTWYAQQETPLVHENTTPALTLFNGGIVLAYIDHSGNNDFYASFASH